MEGGDWCALYAISKSGPLDGEVLMIHEAPRRADLGCGGKI